MFCVEVLPTGRRKDIYDGLIDPISAGSVDLKHPHRQGNMTIKTTIVWFRQDLRLSDNPALYEAAKRGRVLPVFILEDERGSGETHPMGGASRWWLHHSLAALQTDLPDLVLVRGDPRLVLPDLAERAGADTVFWNRCYEPYAIARDTEIKAILKASGKTVTSFNGSVLHEPWEVKTGAGGSFKVFTPFWKNASQRPVAPVLPKPANLSVVRGFKSDPLESLALCPRNPDWAAGWTNFWNPGEAGAGRRLEGFLTQGLSGYGSLRNRPDLPNVSRLSPHLHFGEISPRQIWHRTRDHLAATPASADDAGKFLSEVGWREFSHHLLYHFPQLPERNWRPAFDVYPWRSCRQDLKRWQQGETGYPIVDAGMRELWQTGYMHNRVRMISASFLVKHLRIDWRHGEAWFRDTLVDADLANNSAGWQWVAGSGADASPYFRIFNPITQGAKFDPAGDYVRKWVPELAGLDVAHLFEPFNAPDLVLRSAGIELGTTYPRPVVDHKQARQAALDGYEKVRQAVEQVA